MLIEFTVKNYKSIRDEQKLSMVAARGDEHQATHTFTPTAPAAETLLHSAAVYGANASGKSNLLKALYAMQEMVVLSTSWQNGTPLPVVPFLLDEACSTAPTEFEVIFLADGVRYQYGFSANNQRIVEEWLFASPRGRTQHWFNREWDAGSSTYHWEFGKSFAGEKQLWQKSTRDNALFLSTAAQLNSKALAPVFVWFLEKINILGADALSHHLTADLCREQDAKGRVLVFLQAADFDIADLMVRVEPPINPLILADNTEAGVLRVSTVHQTGDGRQMELKITDESDGMRKIFAFAGPWIDTLQSGGVLLVDELHGSLHPKLVHFLVNLFHSSHSNPNHAQLIFTTHDTAILNQDLFRRDQIWFFEKDRSHAVRLYPLTDFHPRKDRENLLANYLDGRYGALPTLRDWAPSALSPAPATHAPPSTPPETSPPATTPPSASSAHPNGQT